MEDTRIIELYWQRSHQAIQETKIKYGGYCFTIAKNLLGDERDAEECVSDTYLGAWNAMPPHRPRHLNLFLAKITRRLAFNRFDSRTARKRGGGELPLVLEELDQCIAGGTDPEALVEARELKEAIQAFVSALPPREQSLFVKRYFFTQPISQVAREMDMTANHVSVALSRIREKLRAYLIKEEFCYE